MIYARIYTRVHEGSTAPRVPSEYSVVHKLLGGPKKSQQGGGNAVRGNDASAATEHAGGRGHTVTRGDDASAATEPASRKGGNAARGNDVRTPPLPQEEPAVKPPTFAEVEL